jgi:parallel beta-helix repeat protein
MRKAIIFALAFLLLLPLAKADTYLTDCAELNVTGETYYLTQDIIDSTATTCMNIQADNVTLDCQGHTIDGIVPNEWSYGVGVNIGLYNSNITIRNCILGEWYTYAIYSSYISNVSILNTTFTYSDYGEAIRFERSENCYMSNITSYKVITIRDSSHDCYLTNLFLEGSYSYIDIESSSSINIDNVRMIDTIDTNIMNSDHINVTNVYILSSIGAIVLDTTEFSSVSNLEIYGKGDNNYGLYIQYSNYNNFTNITISGFKNEGIWLGRYSSGNSFINMSISNILGGEGVGIYVWRESNENYFKGITIRNTSYSGIFLDGYSAYNVFEDFFISDVNVGIWFTGILDVNEFKNGYITNVYGVTGSGIRLEDAHNQAFQNIIVQNSSNCGVYLYSSSDNHFFNNIFNNTNNTCFDGDIYTNNWNTTRQTGTRIYSLGNEIGGNYWTNATGNGYSDTCTDADKDGFCDDPYVLATDNVDYLALSDEYPPPTTTTTLPPVHGVPLLSRSFVGVVMGLGVITFMTTLFAISKPKTIIEYIIGLVVIVHTVILLILLFA